jgi:hypothetical protein
VAPRKRDDVANPSMSFSPAAPIQHSVDHPHCLDDRIATVTLDDQVGGSMDAQSDIICVGSKSCR